MPTTKIYVANRHPGEKKSMERACITRQIQPDGVGEENSHTLPTRPKLANLHWSKLEMEDQDAQLHHSLHRTVPSRQTSRRKIQTQRTKLRDTPPTTAIPTKPRSTIGTRMNQEGLIPCQRPCHRLTTDWRPKPKLKTSPCHQWSEKVSPRPSRRRSRGQKGGGCDLVEEGFRLH